MTPSSLFRLENGQQSITLKKLQAGLGQAPLFSAGHLPTTLREAGLA
jgi:hypothetical protein